MTNGEYLRSLSDDELGKRLCDLFGDCKMCFASEQCSVGHNGMVAWANEESDILPFDKQNSQMTCKDCVSRQSAIKRIDEALARVFTEPCGELILRDLPSAEPERKKGKWVRYDGDWFKTMFKCSECGAMIDINEKYRNFFCYHCGARMDGEQDE